jgi:hypothetical protein
MGGLVPPERAAPHGTEWIWDPGVHAAPGLLDKGLSGTKKPEGSPERDVGSGSP